MAVISNYLKHFYNGLVANYYESEIYFMVMVRQILLWKLIIFNIKIYCQALMWCVIIEILLKNMRFIAEWDVINYKTFDLSELSETMLVENYQEYWKSYDKIKNKYILVYSVFRFIYIYTITKIRCSLVPENDIYLNKCWHKSYSKFILLTLFPDFNVERNCLPERLKKWDVKVICSVSNFLASAKYVRKENECPMNWKSKKLM